LRSREAEDRWCEISLNTAKATGNWESAMTAIGSR
jgi:hypothetical protein